jgi:hypothetical protein
MHELKRKAAEGKGLEGIILSIDRTQEPWNQHATDMRTLRYLVMVVLYGEYNEA